MFLLLLRGAAGEVVVQDREGGGSSWKRARPLCMPSSRVRVPGAGRSRDLILPGGVEERQATRN